MTADSSSPPAASGARETPRCPMMWYSCRCELPADHRGRHHYECPPASVTPARPEAETPHDAHAQFLDDAMTTRYPAAPPDDRSGEIGTLIDALERAVYEQGGAAVRASGRERVDRSTVAIAARRALDERIAGLVRERDEAERHLPKMLAICERWADPASGYRIPLSAQEASDIAADLRTHFAALTPSEARADEQ